MDFGAAMFFTDYSMAPDELGQALEARGFESLWAPEHSHIPASRATPFPQGGPLPKKYYDVATGVCLVAQRDPIQTAKLVASLDRVSQGRFLFGIGGGWNAEEMADHGVAFNTRFASMRERVEAMRRIWMETTAEYHGAFVDFGPMMAWPKPVQTPHPPVLVGGAFPYAARRALRYGNGWVPHASRPQYPDVTEFLPQFREMAEAARRALETVPVTVFGADADRDRLARYRERGVARVVVSLPSARGDEILPILDRWARLIG